MKENPQPVTPPEAAARIWQFADCELDELRHELRVKGAPVDLESKPLDLLLQLVLHAGEVVTKEELLEAVWSGATVVEGSVPTAVSKLRKAIGDVDPQVIVTIPRVGYRMAVPVFCKTGHATPLPNAGLQAGEFVPGREQWRLKRILGSSATSTVWLAEHTKTAELRVFKFAFDGARLKGLKREATLSRYLSESLGLRPDFARVLEWNFETAPFYLESEYGGPNLLEWAESRNGLSQIPIETRLELLAQVAQTVAVAHGLGVLHKDLKPGNILIETASDESLQSKVVDFGIASLLEPGRLTAMSITNLGFTQAEETQSSSRSGTALYLAPEVLLGQSPTASGDVYALGVMLYQLAVGDFRRPLSAGWEADVEDPLLREDIAAAASGDPGKRLNSAADLAERLRTLDQRRIEGRELAAAQRRALMAEQKLAQAQARRPWIIVAAAALALGSIVSLYLFRRASNERDHARRETAISTATNRFLVEDLLSQGDPFRSGESKRSFVDAVNEASSHIDPQFRGEPGIAAQLHWSIAKSLDSRFELERARLEDEHAASLFIVAQGPLSPDAILVHLQEAEMEAGSNQPGSVERARTLLRKAQDSIHKTDRPRGDLTVAMLTVRGLIALKENNPRSAREDFVAASHRAAATQSVDERTRLRIQRWLGYTYIKESNGAQAEAVFRNLIPQCVKFDGADSPGVLEVRMNLAKALLTQRKFAEVIKETNLIYPALVRKLGEDHEVTLQVLSTRAASEGYLGLWDEASRDDLSVHRASMKIRGPAAFLSVGTLSDAALSQCQAGRYQEGEANAREAYTVAARKYGPKAGVTGGSAYSLAICLMGTRKFREASQLLDSIDRKAVTQLSSDPTASADIDLAKAQIAFQEGRYGATQDLINAASPPLEGPAATSSDRQSLEKLKSALNGKLRASK